MTSSLAAVIFDVDGVLVKSMELNVESYRKVLGTLGLEIEPQEVFSNEGRRSRELIDILAKAHGRTLTDAELEQATRLHRETFASFGRMPLYPGAEDLLRDLHRRGLRLAVVTGNWKAIALAPFGGLASLLDAVVSAEDVARTKPDPQPYLKALELLRVPPGQAVVVENAPLGVQAAKAAGLRVIAVTTTNPAESLRDADACVPRLADVAELLLRWR